ncbi:hypothetical protein L3X38_000008 [Prunus dulcis]|uniref:Uncharacterized protein n=1 Tax=Prunus dulcis TaxID=3755 RepID=A0AAD4UQY3_PRUDU|nr:hypothetical protein L3X38_000008 [Prunus dulcis]
MEPHFGYVIVNTHWNKFHEEFTASEQQSMAKKASAIAAKDKGRRLLHECTEKQKVVMKSRLEQGRLNLLMEWRFGLEEDYGPTVGDDQ